MDLNEQARQAVLDAMEDAGIALDSDQQAVARIVFLDGYQAGVQATKAKADEAFAEWQAAQS